MDILQVMHKMKNQASRYNIVQKCYQLIREVSYVPEMFSSKEDQQFSNMLLVKENKSPSPTWFSIHRK